MICLLDFELRGALDELIDATREVLGQWESGQPVHDRTAERLISIIERAEGPGGEDGGRSQRGDPPGA